MTEYKLLTETNGDRNVWPSAFQLPLEKAMEPDARVGFDAIAISLEQCPEERQRTVADLLNSDHAFIDYLAGRHNAGLRKFWVDQFYLEYCKWVAQRYDVGETPLHFKGDTRVVAGKPIRSADMQGTVVPREACRLRAFKAVRLMGVTVDWVIITPLTFHHVVGTSHDLLGYSVVPTRDLLRPALVPVKTEGPYTLFDSALKGVGQLPRQVSYGPHGVLTAQPAPLHLVWKPQVVPCVFGQVIAVPIDVPPQLAVTLRERTGMVHVRTVTVCVYFVRRFEDVQIREGSPFGTFDPRVHEFLGLAVLPAEAVNGRIGYADTSEAWAWASVELYSLVKGQLPTHASAAVTMTDLGPAAYTVNGVKTHSIFWRRYELNNPEAQRSEGKFSEKPIVVSADGTFTAHSYMGGLGSADSNHYGHTVKHGLLDQQLSFTPPFSWEGPADAVTFMMGVTGAHAVRRHLLELLPAINDPGSNKVCNLLVRRDDVLAIFAHLPATYTMVASAVYTDARRGYGVTHHDDYALVSWCRASGKLDEGLPIPFEGGRMGMAYASVRVLDHTHKFSGLLRPVPLVPIKEAGVWYGMPGELLMVSEQGFLAVTRPSNTLAMPLATKKFAQLPYSALYFMTLCARVGAQSISDQRGCVNSLSLLAQPVWVWARIHANIVLLKLQDRMAYNVAARGSIAAPARHLTPIHRNMAGDFLNDAGEYLADVDAAYYQRMMQAAFFMRRAVINLAKAGRKLGFNYQLHAVCTNKESLVTVLGNAWPDPERADSVEYQEIWEYPLYSDFMMFLYRCAGAVRVQAGDQTFVVPNCVRGPEAVSLVADCRHYGALSLDLASQNANIFALPNSQ